MTLYRATRHSPRGHSTESRIVTEYPLWRGRAQRPTTFSISRRPQSPSSVRIDSGMELHGFHGQFAMADAHDDAVFALARSLPGNSAAYSCTAKSEW